MFSFLLARQGSSSNPELDTPNEYTSVLIGSLERAIKTHPKDALDLRPSWQKPKSQLWEGLPGPDLETLERERGRTALTWESSWR